MKKWIIKNKFNNELQYHNIKLINNLLSSRGINDEREIDDFLYPNLNKLHDPFLLKDMDSAIERIDKAIKKRQKIVIYGDYDVDGITSTAILFRAFQKLGVDASYYIPERMNEGYGINKKAIDYIKSLQTNLIITVDCGITSIDEVNYAKSLGMDIIVTDHHECKDAIPDTIVINPKRKDCVYPNKCLAGCGIAFKLVQALWIRYNLYGFEDFLDIAAIGTIADIVELRGENRIIVKNGLAKINDSDKCGIKALKAVSEIDNSITSYNVAFQIAPRINAVGRLSDAKIAVELFVTNDYDKALQIAKFLDMENKRRQKIEETILNEALNMIDETIDIKHTKVIVLVSQKWHHGVVGIVASKLVERFHRPVILLCAEGNICKGSGRSISGFNLFEGLCECNDLLVKYGGHEMAAGLTIDIKNLEDFKAGLNDFGNRLQADIYLDKIYAEAVTDTPDIDLKTAETLKLFEPYGNGNPSPLLYMEALDLVDMKGIGTNGQHLKLSFEKSGYTYGGILFNRSDEFLQRNLSKVDLMYNLDINEWKNNRTLQFMVKDMRENVSYIKEQLEDNYYRFIKFMFSDNMGDDKLGFSGVEFIKKDMDFFKDFVYFNKGYILVTSYESIKEIEFIFDYLATSQNKNQGEKPQIIICPNIDAINTLNNDILIYDFLPGLYEYNELVAKATGKIYNFYDDNIVDKIDGFISNINIDESFFNDFAKTLLSSDITGSIKDISEEYNRNLYVVYKLIMLLKEHNHADIFIKNDILKIRQKNSKLCFDDIRKAGNRNIEKLLTLKIKLKEYLKGE